MPVAWMNKAAPYIKIEEVFVMAAKKLFDPQDFSGYHKWDLNDWVKFREDILAITSEDNGNGFDIMEDESAKKYKDLNFILCALSKTWDRQTNYVKLGKDK